MLAYVVGARPASRFKSFLAPPPPRRGFFRDALLRRLGFVFVIFFVLQLLCMSFPTFVLGVGPLALQGLETYVCHRATSSDLAKGSI